jgi:hypothetical protein
MLIVGLALSLGLRLTTYVLEGFLVIAFGALLGGKFCLGAYVYHLLRGHTVYLPATASRAVL